MIKPKALHRAFMKLGIKEARFEIDQEDYDYRYISDNEFQLSKLGDVPTNYVMRKTQYNYLSPDGIVICPYKNFTTKEKADDYLAMWAERYRIQGYYGTVRDGQRVRIPVDEIKLNCELIEI